MLRIILTLVFLTACSSDVRMGRHGSVDHSNPIDKTAPLHTVAGVYINQLEEVDVRRIDVSVMGGELYATVDDEQSWNLEIRNGRLHFSENSPFGSDGILIIATQEPDAVESTTTLWFLDEPFQRVPTKGACAGPGHFAPTSSYIRHEVLGWTVMLACDYKADVQRGKNIMNEVRRQLTAIEHTVPVSALKLIRETPIWLEYPYHEDTDAAFHPSSEWLVENGFNPEKEGGVELDYNTYLWRGEQPWTLLHELSHAFHAKVLGDDNDSVTEVFKLAVAGGLYKQVRHIGGGIEQAYALNNEFEYFAEISEAYFGFNDFQPFDRNELERFDPLGYALVESAWMVDEKK